MPTTTEPLRAAAPSRKTNSGTFGSSTPTCRPATPSSAKRAARAAASSTTAPQLQLRPTVRIPPPSSLARSASAWAIVSATGQAEDPLGDDVALDLRAAGRDGVGERVEVLLGPAALRLVDGVTAVQGDGPDFERRGPVHLG